MMSSSDAAGSSAGTSSTASGSRADDRRRTTTDRGFKPSGPAMFTTLSTASALSRGPGFTAEDEALEVSALSPYEQIEIECDLRGIPPEEAASRIFAAKGGPDENKSSPSQDETKNIMQLELDASIDEAVAKVVGRRRRHVVPDENNGQGVSFDNLLRQLDRELRSIPDGEKASYLRAIECQCPDVLITHPSGRSRFVAMLKNCGNDDRVAAKRIVEYWEERLRTFGDDRCYLPMALHGTMKDQVAIMLKQATHRMPYRRDDAGRSVLVFDLLPSGFSDTNRISATESDKLELWYMLECLYDYRSPQPQQEGDVFIMNCQGVAEASFHPLAIINQALLMLEAFPIPLRAIHIVRPSAFTLREVLPIIKLDIGKKLRQRLVIHQGEDDEDILGSLEEYGLPRSLMKEALEEPQPNRTDWIHHRLAQEYAEAYSLGEQFVPDLSKRISGLTTTTFGSGVASAASFMTTGSKAGAPPYQGYPRRSSAVSSTSGDRSLADLVGTGEGDIALAIELIDESKNRSGKAGDERMSQAIKAKIQNPSMSHFDALVAGGFVFPEYKKGTKAADIFDSDNVSLHQRKNQLSRRLRHVRNSVALKGGDEEG